jgi:hypothetical protein
MPEKVRLELEAKLLSFGGNRTVFFGPEPHAQLLIERGRLFSEPVKLHRGRQRHCHFNTARLWERATTKCRIVTGYALSNGTWVPHSWVLRDGVLHETTLAREQYFGVELDDLEAVKFWAENLFFHLYPESNPLQSYCDRRRCIFKLLDELMAKIHEQMKNAAA